MTCNATFWHPADNEAKRKLRWEDPQRGFLSFGDQIEPLAPCPIPLAFSLEICPELDIGPVLTGAGAQVLFDIPTAKEVTIASLEGQLAVHEKARPNDIYFVTEMPLVVVRPRKDIDTLRSTIPVILRIGQVQTGGPNFNMVILGRTGRTLVRRWGNGVGVSLHGREQPHAAADHGSLVHRIHAALRPATGVALLVEKGLWSIAGSELRLGQ